MVSFNEKTGVVDSDNVDVYDGEDYNGYKASTATTATAGKLMAFNYFTEKFACGFR